MLKRPDADVRQRERRIGGVGLGLPPRQLATCSLQLPADPRLTRVQVYVLRLARAEADPGRTGGDRRGERAASRASRTP